MIRRQGDNGEVVATCNQCGDREYGGPLETAAFVEQLRAEGWRWHAEVDWWDLCPACAGGER
jgi:hypothetical protein